MPSASVQTVPAGAPAIAFVSVLQGAAWVQVPASLPFATSTKHEKEVSTETVAVCSVRSS